MKTLSIDIETYCEADLPKTGAYTYANDPSFEVILFAYSVDGGPVQVVDLLGGEELPKKVKKALTDPSVVKWAYNAQFERVCLSRYLGLPEHKFLPPEQWRCSMVWAGYLGLPMQLGAVGAALGLAKQKINEGVRLIRYWSKPCKSTKVNGGRTRNLPEHEPEKWTEFKEYNLRDVEVELDIKKRLQKLPVPETVWEEYWVDQHVNDRGIQVDKQLAESAIQVDLNYRVDLMNRMKELTGLDNPNSVIQLKEWLNENGCEIDSLNKRAVEDALETAEGKVKEVLEARAELARSSTKKYSAVMSTAGTDDRIRGLTQFYGANRTGRWAGRLVQVQNLPRNYLEDLDLARRLVLGANWHEVELFFGSVPDTLSQLIRTTFVPKPGHEFIVADFSAIEARVVAWLAGEETILKAFREDKDIYCEVASAMFGVPVDKHGENAELRQKGKITTLACGYQGSVAALEAMGASRMGVKPEELKALVEAWRSANPNIVKLWWDTDKAAKNAINKGGLLKVGKYSFTRKSGAMVMQLPNGRELLYPGAVLGTNRFGDDSVTYMGVNTAKQWTRLETYGGKLVENATQAISRDVLAESINRLEQKGHRVVAHVHDEVIVEAREGTTEVQEICDLLSEPPEWAEGLPLAADGYSCEYYKKD